MYSILGNSSTGRVYAPNTFIRSSAVALHCAMKCTGVSSSSCFRPITLRCRLRLPCPVSRPIKILKCALSSLNAYRVRLLFCPVKNNFACLQPDCAFQSLVCCLSAQLYNELRKVVVLIPKEGSGSINGVLVASLASKSALLLPSTPQCPGTQMRHTLLYIASVFRACTASAAVL